MVILVRSGHTRPAVPLQPFSRLFVFFYLRVGNPDSVITAIVISVSDRWKERCGDNKVSLLAKMH